MHLQEGDVLGYRQFNTTDKRNKAEFDFSGCYGPVCPLLGAEDWGKAVADLCKSGERGLDVEIEVFPSTTKASISRIV